MAKCGVIGCSEKAVGGFQEMIEAGDMMNPSATLPGLRTFWCEYHKESLQAHVLAKRGVWLRGKDLEK